MIESANLRYLLVIAVAAALAGCGNQDSQTSTRDDAGSDAATSANDAKQANTAPGADEAPVSSAELADGSMDLHFTAKTVGRNSSGDTSSAQCQLEFTATNRSQARVKSLIAEFLVTRASDGSVVESEATLVMPFEIPPGETKDAWGATTFDNMQCDDLQIAVQEPQYGMCLTLDESPCPAYRLTGEGVASVK